MSSLLILHGWGKTDKLTVLATEGLSAGVVLSPAVEPPEALRVTADSVRPANQLILLDPQGYVSTISDAVGRYHSDNEIEVDLRNPMDAAALNGYVERLVALNQRLGTSQVIAPAPIQTNLLDTRREVVESLVRTTIEQAGNAPVLASLIARGPAFADWDAASAWLEEATAIECAGYFVVPVYERTPAPYPRALAAEELLGQMRLTYRLNRNDYQVVFAYRDVEGLLDLACGALACASGWSNRYRLFETASWQPQTGGQPPRRRIYCPALLTAALVDELRVLPRDIFEAVVPPEYRAEVRGNAVSQEMAHMSFLRGLGRQTIELTQRTAIPARLEWLSDQIVTAEALLSQMRQQVPGLQTSYLNRMASMRTAIAAFRDAEHL